MYSFIVLKRRSLKWVSLGQTKGSSGPRSFQRLWRDLSLLPSHLLKYTCTLSPQPPAPSLQPAVASLTLPRLWPCCLSLIDKAPCDYLGPWKILQDNLPNWLASVQSHLQNPFCGVRYDGHRFQGLKCRHLSDGEALFYLQTDTESKEPGTTRDRAHLRAPFPL